VSRTDGTTREDLADEGGTYPLAVPSSVPAKARDVLTHVAGLAADLGFGTGGVFTTLSSVVVTLTQHHQRDAWQQFQRTLEEHGEALEALESRVEAGEVQSEELHRRLTTSLRAIAESGRHPDRALRHALGALAARVLVADVDGIDCFEAAEVLGRMTAMDYETFLLLYDGPRGNVSDSEWASFAAKYDFVGTAIPRCDALQEGVFAVTGGTLAHLLEKRYPGTSKERAMRVVARLDRERLIHAASQGRGNSAQHLTPTEFGRLVVRLSRLGPAGVRRG